MKINKLIYILCFLIVLFIPTKDLHAQTLTETTGRCGDNVTWEFDEGSGTLTISGSGEMYNYRNGGYNSNGAITGTTSHSPFEDCSNICNIIIEDGITSIGAWMFWGCDNVTNVLLTEDITRIKDNAFYSCKSLSHITLPQNLQIIEDDVFAQCRELQEIVIPENVSSIGDCIFRQCYNLENITVDPNNTTFDSRNNCNAIIETATDTLVTTCEYSIIPKNIKNIAPAAFAHNQTLTSITLPNSMTTLGGRTFEGCSNLTTIILPDTLQTIEYRAFNNCDALTTINLPTSIININDYAFYDCDNLKQITIQDGVEHIGTYAFARCVSLKKILLPDTITTIDSNAFCNCSNLTTIKFPQNLRTISRSLCCECQNLSSIEFPKNLLYIEPYAFSHCFFDNMTLPDTLQTIRAEAFNSYSGDVYIPKNVSSIDSNAFSFKVSNVCVDEDNPVFDSRNDCNAIIKTDTNTLIFGTYKTIIPNTVTSIGENAFVGIPYNSSVSLPQNPLKSIYIPKSVSNIGKYAFGYQPFLEEVLFEDVSTITNIDNYAFDECYQLTQTDDLDVLYTLNPLAFSNTYYNQPIDDEYDSCDEHYSFDKQTSTLTITGEGVLDGYINYQHARLAKKIVISEGFTEISSNWCSCVCYAEEIILPNTMQKLNYWSFSDCPFLKSLYIPASVTEIDDTHSESICEDCPRLETIIVDENNPIYDSRDNCNAIIKTATNHLIVGCKNTVIPNSITSIGHHAFDGSGIESLIIPSSVTSIGSLAFNECYQLKNVYVLNSNVIELTKYENNYTQTLYYYNRGLMRFSIYVLPDLVDNYKQDYIWSDYNNRFQALQKIDLPKTLNVTPNLVDSHHNYYIAENLKINNINDYTLKITNATLDKDILTPAVHGTPTIQIDISSSIKITNDDIISPTYNTQSQCPDVVLKDNDTLLINDVDYTLSYNNNIDACDNLAEIIVSGKGNYIGSKTIYFSINKADLSPSVTISNWTYNDIAAIPNVSGNIENGAVTYSYQGIDNSGNQYNSQTAPVNAGNYKVIANIAATSNYNESSCEKSFVINRADISPLVSIDDWIYKEEASSPKVEHNLGNADVTFKYKSATNPNDAYTAIMPCNAGDYIVQANILESPNYNSGVATATFKIKKADINPSVSIDNWIYKQDAKIPVVNNNSGGGLVSYTYKSKDSNEYSTQKPINAGEYDLKATIAETDNYNGAECQTSFTINKTRCVPEVFIANWTYGSQASTPVVSKNLGDGTIDYQYKERDAADTTYSNNIPINAGNYTIKANISETANYLAATATYDFKINKTSFSFTVSLDDWTYQEEPNIPTISNNPESGLVSYLYKGENGSFSNKIPTNAGTYTVKAIISDTSNYVTATATNTFTIRKATISPTVTIDSWLYKESAKNPVLQGNTGNGFVSYSYSIKNEDNYNVKIPTNPGDYTLKAVISESDNYLGATTTCDFSILGVTVNTPAISISNNHIATITAGDVDNDEVGNIYYSVDNEKTWIIYQTPVTLYKKYSISAKQIAKRSGVYSDIVSSSGEELPVSIKATYTGSQKYLSETIDLNDIKVLLQYPNSEDETITNFSIDKDTIDNIGENIITVNYKTFSDSIIISGLRKNTSIKGRITYADGLPYANKDIILSNKNSNKEITSKTDDDGCYEFSDVEIGEYVIKAVENGVIVYEETININGLSNTGVLVNDKKMDIQDKVDITSTLSYVGNIPMANVKITFINKATGQVYEIWTDENGNYSLKDIPIGNYDMIIETNGVIIYNKTITIDGSKTIKIDKITSCEQYITVNGVLTQSDGSAAAKQKVYYTNKQTNQEFKTTTNSRGYYEINHLPIGNYLMQIVKDGHIVYEESVAVGGKSTLTGETDTFTHTPIANITGRFTFKDGTPIKNKKIVLVDKSNNKEYVFATDDDGRYSLEELPVGEYTISILNEDDMPIYQKTMYVNGENDCKIKSEETKPTEETPTDSSTQEASTQNNTTQTNTQETPNNQNDNDNNIINQFDKDNFTHETTQQIKEDKITDDIMPSTQDTIPSNIINTKYSVKLKKIKVTKNKKIQITCKTSSKGNFMYEYQVANNKKMNKAVTFKSSKNKVTKKLKIKPSKNTYFVRVRLILDDNTYSNWSKITKAKIKKK